MSHFPTCPACKKQIEYNVLSPSNEYVCPYCKASLKFDDKGSLVARGNDIKIAGLNAPIVELPERVVNINAPPEEMKAFQAGCRVGYKAGFEAGYLQRVAEEDQQLGIQPSEVLFNKPS